MIARGSRARIRHEICVRGANGGIWAVARMQSGCAVSSGAERGRGAGYGRRQLMARGEIEVAMAWMRNPCTALGGRRNFVGWVSAEMN